MTLDDVGAARISPGAPEEPAVFYLRAVARHWRLALAIMLVAVAAAAVTVARRTRDYQATASILVTPVSAASPDLSTIGAVTDSGDPSRNVQTAAALVESPAAATAAAAQLGRGWTRGMVQSDISVTPLGQSDVLSVIATAPSPQLAQRLANVYTAASLANRAAVVEANVHAQLGELEARLALQHTTTGSLATDLATRIDDLAAISAGNRDPSLALASRAQLPGSATGASPWLILALALVGGLALGGVAAVLLDRFGSVVRDEAEVRELLRAPILAGIPKLPSRGHRAPAPAPRSLPPDAQEQFRLLREQLSLMPEATAVVVTSSDASDGKTTVATGLAAALAEAQQDVILMDMDLAKPDIATVFGLSQRVDSAELTDWRVPVDELLVEVPEHPRLRVLPTRQADLVAMESVIDRFPHLLAEVKQLCNWVIIDAPPIAAVSSSIRLIQVCDAVVVAVRPRHTDRSRLIVARDVLSRVHAFLAGSVLIGQPIARISSYGYGYGSTWQERDSDAPPRKRLEPRRSAPTKAPVQR